MGKRTRSKHNRHQNNQMDSFKQKTKDDFPLLGLITKRSNGMYSIKGKPNSLRSRAKSAVDITIRNLGEFSNFPDQGHFQRQHISSLLSQCFNPSFTFNAIYHNVARLINRRILKSTSTTMPMNYRIKNEHYPLLNKLADLFFQTQSLSVLKHLLLPNTRLINMINHLLGCSDGSLQFSTACIYLVSCDIITGKVHTSLITTSSKIAEDTIFAQSQESIPIKEMHGLLLCADSMIKTVEGFQECKIPIDGCLIGVDAVSQIIALRSPPSQFMSRMRKYYANINMHLYKLAELTNQLKENIVFWINQKGAFNPSDLLGKFHIDKDPVSKWMDLSKLVLQPPWLQLHPDNYLQQMLIESQEKIRAQTTGGTTKKPLNEEELLAHDCVELKKGENVMINFIDVQDRFKPVRNKPVDFHPLETIVRRNKFKGSNYCLKIMGYVTWIVHNWRDKVYLRKHKACNHPYLCECKKKLLADRKFDRPFTELPIRDPQVINHVIGHNCKNHILVQPSAKDEERLIRVGLLVSTVVSADNTSSPAIPSYMDKYTISKIRLNNAVCKAYSGRFLRYQAALIPSRHAVAWIEVSSPLMELISAEVHKKLSCRLGPQSYINGIHVAGFCATSLIDFIKDQIGACKTCTRTKMLMKGDSTLKQTLKTLYGPDDFLGTASSTDPMSIVCCDEAGPFYIQDGDGAFRTTYILACVELLSYKVHLIPIPKIDTIHFVRALEILQSMRGKFTTLILDDHTVHRPLDQTEESAEHIQKQQSILAGVLEAGNAALLANAGIQIVIASPNRHEKLGRAEFIVKKLKFFLASALRTWAFNDSFDFYHKVSLIALYLNERPLFHTPEGIITPYSLEQAMLKRASAKPKFFTLAEFLIPSDKKMYNQILKMASFSKQILFEVAAAAAFTLLNKRTLNKKFQVGELVYIPGRLLKKHPNSLRDALGKIKEVSCSGRDYTIEMIDGGTLKRHFSDLVSASATKNQSDITLIDPFQLVDFKTRILPEHLYPKFRLQLEKFKNQNPHIDITEVPDDYSQDQVNDDHPQDLTGDQRVDRALGSNDPNEADELIRN